ncbi:MAG: hypothetical protein EKK40_15540 [Bradyrhizobiaceae bacterium]|nr:MAG: hypothetical protein EKK40_15540 [Bradyrhizobiaceae bacterium]
MAVTTRARPAKKPAGVKDARAKKTLAENPASKKTPSNTASNTASKKKAVQSRAVSVVTIGRNVPSKILNEDMSAPVGVLLARVSGAIEDELTQIEMIVSGGTKLRERNQAERRARTLASLARTLREVMQLRAGEEKARHDDDAVPRDIGELRRELARRLERIVAGAKAAHPDAAE